MIGACLITIPPGTREEHAFAICSLGIVMDSRSGKTIINNAITRTRNENQKQDLELSLFDVVIVATASNQFSFQIDWKGWLWAFEQADTISSGQSLRVGQTLISAERNFEFGFFSPGNSTNYYIGIWYKGVPRLENTIPWVTNRDTPLRNPAACEIRLLEDGNLVLFEGSNRIWSTNLTATNNVNSTEGVLLNDGNLLLRNVGMPSRVLWQSFDCSTDTFGPGRRIGYERRTNRTQVLTSWKNVNDPSTGEFTVEMDPYEDRLLVKRNNTQTYWASVPWNGPSFIQPITTINRFFNFEYVKNENEHYLTYDVYNSSIIYRLVIEPSGRLTQYYWNNVQQDWISFWSQPRTQCDIYAYCGAFSVCSMQDQAPSCQCIQGFEPRDPRNWHELGNFSGGCVRRTPLQCGDLDGFLPMSRSRMVGNQYYLVAANEEECRLQCINNCSCSAYAYSYGCSIWNGELLSLHQISDMGNTEVVDIYIRLANSDMHPSAGNNMRSYTWIIVGTVAAALVLGVGVSYIWYKKRADRKGNQKDDFELPVFDFVTVATATNQFSLSNKIGKGGFGPVYKGVLPTGEEIAIKRLSKDSSQGLQEFMTEVRLIAKLQHRNLVRLLGCCVQGDERMLIYEYMHNKSLDSFIFDKLRSVDLNWTQRFNVIVGIARGLLYLHQDSRLRIIHRDLKAGNVLLDTKMNPKISDFGMAKTFDGDQIQDNTNIVVGTQGYMAPEYATEGLFSVKSDVFSFGVLLLEIVSGKKNRGFRHASHDLNLLGHTWKLMNNNETLELMDESIKDPFPASEVLKCIQVGLLCVQKFPEDRPTMASVVSMLDADGVLLPSAKEPEAIWLPNMQQKDTFHEFRRFQLWCSFVGDIKWEKKLRLSSGNHDLNLLGHTWNLVNNNQTLELVDEWITVPFPTTEVCRCIQVGLLRVQKFPEDRPTMAYVVSMLDADGVLFPSAKEPGFYIERSPFWVGASSSQDTNCTSNEITVTLMNGR